MNTSRLFTAYPGWNGFGPRRQAVLISFAWNLGSLTFTAKGFETISSVLNEGARKPEAYSQMPDALNLYVKANGVELEGLKIRRRREGDLMAMRGQWEDEV